MGTTGAHNKSFRARANNGNYGRKVSYLRAKLSTTYAAHLYALSLFSSSFRLMLSLSLLPFARTICGA